MNWKIASVEMPKDGVEVIAVTETGKRVFISSKEGRWHCKCLITGEDIIAWSYIPEFDIEPFVREKVMKIIRAKSTHEYNGEEIWKYVGWQNAFDVVDKLMCEYYGATIKDTMTAEEVIQSILSSFKR